MQALPATPLPSLFPVDLLEITDPGDWPLLIAAPSAWTRTTDEARPDDAFRYLGAGIYRAISSAPSACSVRRSPNAAATASANARVSAARNAPVTRSAAISGSAILIGWRA